MCDGEVRNDLEKQSQRTPRLTTCHPQVDEAREEFRCSRTMADKISQAFPRRIQELEALPDIAEAVSDHQDTIQRSSVCTGCPTDNELLSRCSFLCRWH